MEPAELQNRFSFHPAKDERVAKAHEDVRAKCKSAAFLFDGLLAECDEKKRAIDSLDDAMKHANAAIARHGLSREEGPAR